MLNAADFKINEAKSRLLSGKKLLHILVLLFLIAGTAMGQGIPQAFKYQAVIRTPSGSVIADTPVELKITIKADPSEVYNELHETTTNAFGLVNLDIGTGQILFGDFTTIDWAAAAHFMTVEVSVNGHPFVDMGTTQLLSVPYAFVAQKAVEGDADDDPNNELQTLSQSGTDVTLSDGGGTITVVDADSDSFNELQNWSNLPGIPNDIADGDDVDDADADPTNEIELPVSPQDGAIAFYNSGDWQVLAPGTEGQVLTLSSGLPVWADPTGPPPPLQIGDIHAGGYIFYLDGSGEHGLVAALTDLPNATWGCVGTLVGGTSAGLGTGQANTTQIVNNACHIGDGITSAAEACDNYDDGTYDDWFLPSKDELDLMYLNIGQGAPAPNTNVGGFAAVWYWSSTEDDNLNAWSQDFSVGVQGGFNKDTYFEHVRAARAF